MSGILGINKDDTDDTADNTEITDVIIICDEKTYLPEPEL